MNSEAVAEGSSKTQLLNVGSKSDALASVGRLPEEVQASVKRFFKGSSNAYDEFIVEHLSNGNYLVKMKKHGNVPGSKAIYYKEIGADGSSLKAYKETFDPQGNLVHSKDKMAGVGGKE